MVSAPAAAASDAQDTTTALYRAILGEVRTDYYLAVFDRMDAAQSWRPHWNWAASLCTLSWLVFRQLWRAALYYAGCVIAGFLLIFGIGRLVFQFSPTAELVLVGAFIGVLFAVPGLLGTTLLHADCRKRMTLALRSSNTDEEARLALLGQASTRRRLAVLVAINTLCLALIGLAASQWLEFSASAGSLARPAAPDPNVRAATPLPTTTLSAPVTTPASAAVSQNASAAVVPAAATAALAAASAPVATAAVAPASIPAAASAAAIAAPRPVTGTAGRSAQGPVPWEAMKIAPPQPDIGPTPAIRPHKLSIDSPWAEDKTAAVTLPRQVVPAKPAKTSPKEKPLLINVGLFAIEDNARKVYHTLEAAGLPATLQPFTTTKGQRFRVRVGPYPTRAEAEAAARTIRAMSLEAVVFDSPQSGKR